MLLQSLVWMPAKRVFVQGLAIAYNRGQRNPSSFMNIEGIKVAPQHPDPSSYPFREQEFTPSPKSLHIEDAYCKGARRSIH